MTQEELLQETHDMVLKLHAVVVGENGDTGIIGRIDSVCNRQDEIEREHHKLSKVVWILIGTLTGSGAIGAGVYQLLKALGT